MTLAEETMFTWKVCTGSTILSSTIGITTSRVSKLSSPMLKVTVSLVLDGKSSGDTAVPLNKVKLKIKKSVLIKWLCHGFRSFTSGMFFAGMFRFFYRKFSIYFVFEGTSFG